MKLYQLSFAKMITIRDDIVELIVNDSVEVDSTMVDEYNAVLRSISNTPLSVLVNKINNYSYTFEAQSKIPSLEIINATAVVTYSNASRVTTAILDDITPADRKWNMRLFSDRDVALAWLTEEQKKFNKSNKKD